MFGTLTTLFATRSKQSLEVFFTISSFIILKIQNIVHDFRSTECLKFPLTGSFTFIYEQTVFVQVVESLVAKGKLQV